LIVKTTELNKGKSAYDNIISKYSFILNIIYKLDPLEIREGAKKLRTIYKQDLDESFENECANFQSVGIKISHQHNFSIC